MKKAYVNAYEILPRELLEEVQQFAEGQLVYIPNKTGTRRAWGENTETQSLVKARNEKIMKDRISGMSVPELTLKYHLSESTVQKIVYKNKGCCRRQAPN